MAEKQEDFVAGVSQAQLEADPYPIYARLREEAPVALLPQLGTWMVTRWDDVKTCLSTPDVFGSYSPDKLSAELVGGLSILDLDGEEHQRYRAAIQPSLRPRNVTKYADGLLYPVIDRFLDNLASHSEGDLVSEYFDPISVVALGIMMGFPEIRPETLVRWMHGLFAGSGNFVGDPEVAANAMKCSNEMSDALMPLLEKLDRDPDDSITAHLISHGKGETFEDRVADVMPTLKIAVLGGLQEPGHAAENTMAAILADEDTRQRLARSPEENIDAAVDEGLRWMSPLPGISRVVQRDDAELAGTPIPKGASLIPNIASANRDESVWGAEAERFDLDRPHRPNLAFGFASHVCVGNFYGKLLMRYSIGRLFQRFPDIHLTEPVEFRGFAVRSPIKLACEWAPR
jgi:cytochrome P450